jgi:methylenetetrahydrofolate reductase (NADPH)
MIDHYLSCQIRLFLALRGDIAVDRPVANDWTTAEFVEALRRRNRNYLRHDRNTQIHALANPLTIAVACFPGGNSALGTDNQGEVDRLLEKQDAGADFAISQVFYKPQVFDEFMTLARKQGVTIPIIAGILPQNNLIGIQKSAKILGVSAPTDILAFFAKLEETEDGQELITKYYADLCKKAYESGSAGYHFFTMNKPDLALNVLKLLNIY